MTLAPHHYETNRLALLSRLAGDISHEIKNPLHAMVINLELVRRKVEKGETARALERIAIIEEEIRKVHLLSHALLEALRPPRDTQDTCSFSTVFLEFAPLVEARARCARVELRLEAAPSAHLVALPAHEARLLLLNLADRAVRMTRPGGAIAMRLDNRSPEAIGVEVLLDSPPVDNGELAWLRDQPADAEHIDLGLRVLRDLVGRTGGRIATDRADDRHRLSVTMPAAASA